MHPQPHDDPDQFHQDPLDTVVVGIDDSEESRAALHWAAGYARSTGSRLVALHVLGRDTLPLDWAGDYPGMAVEARAQAVRHRREAVTEIFAQVHPPEEWVLEFNEGLAGRLLVERTRSAGLLVIGTREHSGVSRLLNGSVSHYCLSHAHGPVVAVPLPSMAPSRRARRESGRAAGGAEA